MLLGIVFRPALLTSVRQSRNSSNKSLILAASTSLGRRVCSKSRQLHIAYTKQHMHLKSSFRKDDVIKL